MGIVPRAFILIIIAYLLTIVFSTLSELTYKKKPVSQVTKEFNGNLKKLTFQFVVMLICTFLFYYFGLAGKRIYP
jgi:cellobiose-specific phosphotransferase system component IIC